jgi:hypothetical protein
LTGNLSDATSNVHYGSRSCLCLQFLQERRFEERQLLQPDGISDDQVELFEANLGRPGMGRHGLAHDVTPAMLQAKFQQSRFKTKPLGKT